MVALTTPEGVIHTVVRARSETEAAWMLAEAVAGTKVIAGGTDLSKRIACGRHGASRFGDGGHR